MSLYSVIWLALSLFTAKSQNILGQVNGLDFDLNGLSILNDTHIYDHYAVLGFNSNFLNSKFSRDWNFHFDIILDMEPNHMK